VRLSAARSLIVGTCLAFMGSGTMVSAQIVEIRSYNLKPGTRDRFHELFQAEALPLLRRWKVEVVGYGPSLHDRDSYYLMRAFPSLEERARSEDAFYASDEWRQGPREAILACIESYTTVVVRSDEATLRASSPSDLAALTALNQDYLRSVQMSDARRFDEILAPDFLCSNPDGSLVDRAGFLAQTARPVTISNLQARDVVVRILGDVALIHARTTYTLADGREGRGRYTDVWARRQGRWLCVSAHVTRA
jgi:ketosteroid isomerase-like protein